MPPEGPPATPPAANGAQPAGTTPAGGAPASSAQPPPGAPPDATTDAQRQRFAEVTKLTTTNLNLTRELGTLKEKLGALEKEGVNIAALRTEAKANPLKVMQALGLDFKEVADFVINSKEGPPDPVKQQLEALARQNEALENKLTEREQAEAQAKLDADVQAAKGALQGLIDTGDGFELLKVYQSAAGETGADLVWNIMLEHFSQHGTALDETVAATAAEDWLTAYGETLAGTKKVQERLEAKREAQRKADEETRTPAKAGGGKKSTDAKKAGATLTNNATAALPAGDHDDEVAVPGTVAFDRKVARVAAEWKAKQAQQ